MDKRLTSQAKTLGTRNLTKIQTQNHLYHRKALEKRYTGLLNGYGRFLNVIRENERQTSRKRHYFVRFRSISIRLVLRNGPY